MANKDQLNWRKGKPRGYRKTTECHPERPHYGCGLCRSCWRQRRGESRREHYQAKYGISELEFEALISAQNNCCALCDESFVRGNYRDSLAPNMDHDHLTGKKRAVIHSNCNRLLGLAHDNPTVLEQAANYLRRYQ